MPHANERHHKIKLRTKQWGRKLSEVVQQGASLIHLREVLFVGLIVAAITARAWLFVYPQGQEERWDKMLTFVVSVVACAAAIYAIYDAGKHVQENTEHQRIEAAFVTINHFFDDRARAGLIDFRFRAIRDGLKPEEIDKVMNKENRRSAVTNMFTNFEIMALAIKSKHVNEDVLYYSLRKFVTWAFGSFEVFISEGRKQRGPGYLIELQDLVDAWRAENSLVSGRKFSGENYNEWIDAK